ncbi:hypothetical protein ACHAXR_009157, partial [Thalassiosira sp. AJA248-18]
MAVVATHVSSALSIVSIGKLQSRNIHSRRTPNTSSSLLHAVGHSNDIGCECINNPIDKVTADLPRRGFVSTVAQSLALLALSAAPQTSNAAYRDPKSGILLPSVGEIESAIPTTWDEDDNPVSGSSTSFSRLDSSPDKIFYSEPRFVEHVDEQAVESMTSYISGTLLKPGDSVLDLCSSWTSHIRPGQLELKRVAGLGMNAKELEANKSLTDWTVQDLNVDKNVKLPYDDESFDVIILQLSIDYLIHPLEVMKEASRVLKKNGKIAILFSNRLFLSKAVGLWTGSDDIE